MYYTIIKQWKTIDGNYYSATDDKADYDTAIGDYHAMFKPTQNDTNVAYFRLTLIDENGVRLRQCAWTRPAPVEADPLSDSYSAVFRELQEENARLKREIETTKRRTEE